MVKIIFVGRGINRRTFARGTGKTLVAREIVLAKNCAIFSQGMDIKEIDTKAKLCERIVFDGFGETDHSKYIINILSSDSLYSLTHIVCCYQEAPEWLTESFIKQNNITVFNI